MSRTSALAAVLALVLVTAASLTAAVRRYAIRRAMLDVPNARSSHTAPTPRGGGLAIVATVLGGAAVLAVSGWVERSTLVALAAGIPVALVGWIDDRRGVSARTRMCVHLGSALGAVLALGGLPTLRLGPFGALALGPGGGAVAVLAVAWLTNLYNFMDGIDGLAAGEAVGVGTAAGALAWWGGAPHVAAPAWLVAAASAGFLGWNWAPARIFMGDVGSGFLGFTFGVLALASERQGGPASAAWIFLLAAFVFDATVTLVRRAWYGESVTTPHRAHAYQRATQAGATHAVVAGVYLAFTTGLAGLAWLAAVRPVLAPVVATGAAATLAGAYALLERRQPMRKPSNSTR